MKGELQKNNQLKICKTSSYVCYKFKNKVNVSSNTWYENEYQSNMPAVKMAGTKQNKQKRLIFIAVHQFEEKKINSVDFTKLKGEGCGFSYL